MIQTESFDVDPANPGEILACAGLAWLAEREHRNAESGFERNADHWSFDVWFPERSLAALLEAEPVEDGEAVELAGLRLDWWRQGIGLNQPFKFWAGQQTARSVLMNLVTAARSGSPRDWLNCQAPTTGRLGVDPAGSWSSLQLGWSPNEHQEIKYLCRPFVELLAFVALQRFIVKGSRETGFRYSLWTRTVLPIAVIAFAGSSLHSDCTWLSEIAGSGSNKILKPAVPIGE